MKRQWDGWILTSEEYRILQLIAEGYSAEGFEDRYIRVENPNYKPDNGSDPYLVLSIVDKEDY